ncbi:hypothetical protein AAMO2058_000371800 [Amorphochlora amoebiformis]
MAFSDFLRPRSVCILVVLVYSLLTTPYSSSPHLGKFLRSRDHAVRGNIRKQQQVRFRRALSIPWKNARPNKRDAIVRYTKQAEWNGRKLGEMVDPEELRMKGIEDMYQREVEWGPGFMTDEEIDKWAIPHGVDSNMTYFEQTFGTSVEDVMFRIGGDNAFTANRGRTAYFMYEDMFKFATAVEAIAKAFLREKYMTELVMVDCQMHDFGVAHIAGMLKKNRVLKKVRICQQEMTSKGAEMIAEALAVNDEIDILSLYGNKIRARGAQAIADVLTHNNTGLRRLCLWHNKIGDKGAKALAEMLKVNDNIEDLNLANCNIGREGAEALAEALRVNDRLKHLDLRQNHIGDEGAIAISKALVKNEAIESIVVWDNGISEEYGIPALHYALDLNWEYKNHTGEEMTIWIDDPTDSDNRPNTTTYKTGLGAVIVDESKMEMEPLETLTIPMKSKDSMSVVRNEDGEAIDRSMVDVEELLRRKQDID